jgi:hypothetical protein
MTRLVDAAECCRLSRGRTGFDDLETRQAAETLIALLGAAIMADPGGTDDNRS